MHLGVLMAGEGMGALSAIGVLRALRRKGIGVHAVCGMDAGAYPAALWACGMDENEMLSCACALAAKGKRLMDGASVWHGARPQDALFAGRVLTRMLQAQTQGIALRACERRAAFVCMAVPGRKTVVFSPQETETKSSVWTDHAPVFFAARAAMATPPLWQAANFIGIPLCAHPDAREGVRALYRLGATHVLAVYPAYVRAAPQTPFDVPAWERTVALDAMLRCVSCLRVELHEIIRPVCEDAASCIRAGERCAMTHIDQIKWGSEAGKVVLLRRF